ncbi:response regulator [Phenylobacterium sp.]|uniref:response regulator n=1 Tax=Phenylobacterium sp. TaxID=1871053 RepID=UPI0039835305
MSAVAPLVLLVDDEPLLIELLEHRLELEGYRVVTARDGGAALDLAAIHKPDVIVLDSLMPIADGFEVLRRLNQDPELAQIPVVMLTGIHTDTHAVTAFKLGAVDFLTKPFLPDDLVARVQRLAPVDSQSGL